MRSVLLSVSLLFLSACVTTVGQYDGRITDRANVASTSYDLGQVYRVTVGDNILKREQYTGYYVHNELQPTNSFVISGGLMSTAFSFQGSEEEIFPIVAQNNKGNPMFRIPGTRFMMGVGTDGYWDNTVASANAMTSPIGSGGQYSLTPSTTRFEAHKIFKWKKGTPYINHELLLTGFSSSGIHLLFREYTPNDLIRASFSQEAVYPLNSKNIEFKKYKLEILNQDSNSLTYKVVAD